YTERLEELERSDNPFARFVVAHLRTLETQDDYETRLQWKLRLIQGLYDMGLPEDEIGQLGHDFDWLLALPEPLSLRYHNAMTQFEEEKGMPHVSTAERIGMKIGREKGLQEGRTEGRLEGLQLGRDEGRLEGRLEGTRGLLLNQLAIKFGSVTDEI